MSLLEYENQIFLDTFHEDGLLILAKGLGLERILLNFIKVYCDPAQLVLVLNTSTVDEEYFLEQLEKDHVSPLPKVITNEINATERKDVYLQGGVLFVTSRILVVDLLTDRVPVQHISGIIVNRAHKIVESGQEAFILRLYRQTNKTGFIKAFSQVPTAFTSGYSHVERVMKNLFVRKLFLWPRFHANVTSVLEDHKVDVVEVHTPLTPAMLACQTALLDLINACIKELKRYTTFLDTEEITVENAIGKSFERIIRFQLDPVWHQLGPKTRQLVSDLKTLRLVLKHLTQYDSVTFYNMVNSVRTNEKTFGKQTGWLFLDSADSLFVSAKERVYGDPASQKKQKKDKQTTVTGPAQPPVPVLEESTKWQALQEVLSEIEEHNNSADDKLGKGRVLVAAEDDRTCSQIREMLCSGGQTLLARLYNKSIANKGEYIDERPRKPAPKRKKGQSSKTPDDKDAVTLTQMVGKETESGDAAESAGIKDEYACSSQDAYFGVLTDPVTVIHPLHGCSDPYSLIRTLQEVQPRFIILYDPDIEFVRQLEVYKATHPDIPLRVYFLMYTGSVEEQRYLTSLRLEKAAFEYLIREKASMVIPEEREGKTDDDLSLARDTTPANATVNTRKGGAPSQSSAKPKVIVDMREFRSELPSLIHRRGIDIEPVTLEVGDYILTPDICVERKSLSDLIGSLNNGRLYTQSVSMCRFYKRPVLLIEFDPSKSFSIQGNYPMSNDVSLQETTTKLSLLTIQFPKLRILWCQSPYATAELIEELKTGRDQPDASQAMTVSAGEDTIEWSDRYNHRPQALLLKMPGVNTKNYRLIMNKVEDLSELSTLSQETLTEILGNSQHARQLYDFLQSEQQVTDTAVSGKPMKMEQKKWFKRKR